MGPSPTATDGCRRWENRRCSPAWRERSRQKRTAQSEPATSPEIYRSDCAVNELLFCSVRRSRTPEEFRLFVRFSTDLFVKEMLRLPRCRCGKPVNKANT